MRIPGTLWTIWFVRPWAMNPAPRMATRIGLPCSSRAFNALSIMIMVDSCGGSANYGLALDGHTALQFRLDLSKQFPSLIFIRNYSYRKRPFERQTAIIIHQASFGARGIEFTDLVARLGFIAQGLVAMRKTLRYVERSAIIFA